MADYFTAVASQTPPPCCWRHNIMPAFTERWFGGFEKCITWYDKIKPSLCMPRRNTQECMYSSSHF